MAKTVLKFLSKFRFPELKKKKHSGDKFKCADVKPIKQHFSLNKLFLKYSETLLMSSVVYLSLNL